MESAVKITSYRGYLISLTAIGSSWTYAAQPTAPDLPAMPNVIHRPSHSEAAAFAEAKRCIDYGLAVKPEPFVPRVIS